MKKTLYIKLLSVVSILGIIFVSCPIVPVFAEDNTTELTPTYADNSLVVVLDDAYGSVNKSWSANDFSAIEIDTVTDLTEVDEIHYELLSSNAEFYQILELKLLDDGTQTVEAAIDVLSEDPRVMIATPNYYYNYHLVPNDYLYNDPETNLKTIYQLMGAEAAWDITTGSQDVTVGVIDSGVYNHSDFGSNLVAGRDFFNGGTETTDDLVDHGTHVAGIIGAVGNNSIGMVGVNSTVTIVPLQVASGGNYVSSVAVVKAVLYACMNDIDIINCSFGGSSFDYAVYRAMKMYDGLIVCSAGNVSINTDATELYANYPAEFDLPNIISVAASTEIDTLASYSTYGIQSVDLAAPGDNIISTAPGGYTKMSGTSMAAPFVAGTAALLLSYNPNLTACEVKDIILASVDKIDALSGKVASGGRLNIYNALQSVLQGDYRRNITSKLSFSTTDSLRYIHMVVYYDTNRLDLHNVMFDESIAANALYDYSVDGQIMIVIMLDEDMPFSEDLVRCNFVTRQKFILEDNDIAVRLIQAKNANNQQVSVIVSETQALLGDVNCDNEIDTDDTNQMFQVVSGSSTASEQELLAMDVDGNGIVNTIDVRKVMQYVNGTIVSFW